MSNINILAQTTCNTVVEEFTPQPKQREGYQTEAQLEENFIKNLEEQGYEYLSIHTNDDLVANLRVQIEKLNGVKFSNGEWQEFFSNAIANSNKNKIEDKTELIQESHIQHFKFENGDSKNVYLIDKKNIYNNTLQVINQYVAQKGKGENSPKHKNRYDVTILVNGLPLVHVELKKRGERIKEAFNQIERYERESFWSQSGLFNFVQIFVISNGTNTKYYSNTTRWSSIKDRNKKKGEKKKTSNSFEFTSYWADARNRQIIDLEDFTRTFFAQSTILNILTKYCVFTSEKMLLVMRPYQITATERILQTIEACNNKKVFKGPEAGGYIWHTTGSGKTLTSFKTARLATDLNYIDKVLFVVDRKDLDYQTMKEYDRFEKGAADGNASTVALTRQLSKKDTKIIVTTIQKLSKFIKNNPEHAIYNKHVVIIFDECHRSQFGEMHHAIVKHFKKYHMFGFTGTPIFATNMTKGQKAGYYTTEQTFGQCLHKYTIVNAIGDKNVLPFRIDYIKTMDKEPDIDDEKVKAIDLEKLFKNPERIKLVTKYILDNFSKKTYRNKNYNFNKTTNIDDVVLNDMDEIKKSVQVSGFNSIFCVSSIECARLYYNEFKRQMAEHPEKRLKIATIFSYAVNEEEYDGALDEENSESVAGLDVTGREFLEGAIQDYNNEFKTNYSTEGESFQNYYKDISQRMKNKEIDLLLVVNMFLTGFDATTLNTLWVDKNLQMHGLIQAFSRTNRILNSVKVCGNIVCFRNLSKRVDEALARFSDAGEDAKSVAIFRTFDEYFNGYEDDKGAHQPGYVEMLEKLYQDFPLEQMPLKSEKKKKEFINLYNAILRMRNLLRQFDDFEKKDTFSVADQQDYQAQYLDIHDELKSTKDPEEKADVSNDVIFEMELIGQVDINVDYILKLIEEYKDSNCKNKEILVKIQKAVGSSPELRSKKELIEEFIASLSTVTEVDSEWQQFVEKKKEDDLKAIIEKFNLKEKETRAFVRASFKAGEVITIGTGISNLFTMSRFDKDRDAKKQAITEALTQYFERYVTIVASEDEEE